MTKKNPNLTGEAKTRAIVEVEAEALDIARQNIINNIEKFLAFVSTNIDTLECKNEN